MRPGFTFARRGEGPGCQAHRPGDHADWEKEGPQGGGGLLGEKTAIKAHGIGPMPGAAVGSVHQFAFKLTQNDRQALMTSDSRNSPKTTRSTAQMTTSTT